MIRLLAACCLLFAALAVAAQVPGGALLSAVNPEPATSATANTQFVLGFDSSATRNDLTAVVGYKFVVNEWSNVVVKSVSFRVLSGSTQTHRIGIWQEGSASTNLAQVSLSYSGLVSGWHEVELASPLTLTANTGYIIAVSQSNGGDLWYDSSGSNWSTTSVATMLPDNARYTVTGFDTLLGSGFSAGVGYSYAAPNFGY